MRNWKRFAAVMMAAATMVTGLTACGGNGTAGTSGNGDAANSGDENKVSDVEDVAAGTESGSDDGEIGQYTVLTDADGNPYDLGGMDIIIYDWFTADQEDNEDASAYDEAREEYLDWIQSTYNFTIKQMEKAIKANEKNLNIDEQKYFNFVMNTGIINIIDWFNKKSIKLALKIYFVCICIAAGQASIDRFYK